MVDDRTRGAPVVAVFGAAGGCGASTVACGLALAWASAGGSPWLVELDAGRADIAGRWDLPDDRTLADLENVADELGVEHLESAAAAHESGVAVLLGPARATAGVSALVVDRLMAAIDPTFPVVFDLAAVADPGSSRAIASASSVLIVTPSSAAGARQARRAAEFVGELGAADRTRLVATSPDGAGDLSGRGLSRAVGVDLLGILPRGSRDAAAVAAGRWPGIRRRGLGRALAGLVEGLP